jgi:hypothetical protein
VVASTSDLLIACSEMIYELDSLFDPILATKQEFYPGKTVRRYRDSFSICINVPTDLTADWYSISIEYFTDYYHYRFNFNDGSLIFQECSPSNGYLPIGAKMTKQDFFDLVRKRCV